VIGAILFLVFGVSVARVCPECGGEVVYVSETGEFVCKSCGLVVGKVIAGGFVPAEVRHHVVVDEFGVHHRFVDSKVVRGGVEVAVARLISTRKVVPKLWALREYKPTLEEMLAPPEEGGIPVEAVFVSLRQPVTYRGWCKIHEKDEEVRRFDVVNRIFPHVEVSTFKRLLGLKKVKGYAVTPVDGVKAFMIACEYGNKSFAYGFLKAMAEKFREVETTPEHVGETLSRLQTKGIIFATGETVLTETVYRIDPELRVKLMRSAEWWRD
jgi:hypothetical protein